MIQAPYPNCSCTAKDLCKDVKCDDKCTDRTRTAFDIASTNGKCNHDTGECYYDNSSCEAGCVVENEKAHCLEECDNYKDDDGDNLANCDDPDCNQSYYCKCQLVNAWAGNLGGTPLRVLVAGYNFANTAPGPYYNSMARDVDMDAYAQKVYDALASTPPFNEINFRVYAIRYRPAIGIPWDPLKIDVLYTCREFGGDQVVFLNFEQWAESYSVIYSGSATIFIPRAIDHFGSELMHEIAHSWSGLWDEYVTDSSSILGGENCASASNESECKTYFSKYGVPFQCVQNCTTTAYWRSSPTSIMYDADNVKYFSQVDYTILKRKLDMWANPEKYVRHDPIPVAGNEMNKIISWPELQVEK
jgi:hypothetical protein